MIGPIFRIIVSLLSDVQSIVYSGKDSSTITICVYNIGVYMYIEIWMPLLWSKSPRRIQGSSIQR